MDSYKEFQGKTLDQAIQEACKYFDSTREKLEIEIVNDAKTGIFGLVGARKAKIRARRMKIAFSNGEAMAADSSRKGKGKSDSRKSTRREESDSNESRASKKQGGRKDPRKNESRPNDAKGDSRQRDESRNAQPERRPVVDGNKKPVDDGGKKPAGKSHPKEEAHAAPKTGTEAPVNGSAAQNMGENGTADDAQQDRRTGDNRRGRGRKRPADRQRRRDDRPARNDRSRAEDSATDEEKPQRETEPRQQKRREDEDRNGDSRKGRGRRPRKRGGRRDDNQAAQQDNEFRENADDMQNLDDLDSADDHHTDPIPEANLSEMDHSEVTSLVTEVVNQLITPVIGETPVSSEVTENRVKVSIQSGDNSGLLIGREGQTLASFQYLTNRIVAKKLGVAVRVQLDTGDYRERQDEKLRDIALHLADKAKTIGKPQSTRPLSSYHRRIVHLALQEDDTISTRSKGDGPLKRVIIARKRVKNA